MSVCLRFSVCSLFPSFKYGPFVSELNWFNLIWITVHCWSWLIIGQHLGVLCGIDLVSGVAKLQLHTYVHFQNRMSFFNFKDLIAFNDTLQRPAVSCCFLTRLFTRCGRTWRRSSTLVRSLNTTSRVSEHQLSIKNPILDDLIFCSPFFKTFIDEAWTMWSGKLFQIFSVNNVLLALVIHCTENLAVICKFQDSSSSWNISF